MSMKSQNTKRVAKVLPVLKDDFVVWDEVLSQLGRRVRKSRETWIVQTRVGGKTKRRTLGACGEIKVEAARVLAQAYLDEFTNPNAVAQGDTTLAEFAERFLEDCSGQWKPTTLRLARWYGAVENACLNAASLNASPFGEYRIGHRSALHGGCTAKMCRGLDSQIALLPHISPLG